MDAGMQRKAKSSGDATPTLPALSRIPISEPELKELHGYENNREMYFKGHSHLTMTGENIRYAISSPRGGIWRIEVLDRIFSGPPRELGDYDVLLLDDSERGNSDPDVIKGFVVDGGLEFTLPRNGYYRIAIRDNNREFVDALRKLQEVDPSEALTKLCSEMRKSLYG